MTVLCLILGSAFPADAQTRSRDISDRSYLPAVLEQIQAAQQSIDVSMYAIALVSGGEGDPAQRLIYALKAAAGRGVKVRLWLNSRQASIGSTRIFLRGDIQQSLRDEGLQIFYVDSARRLHDKLIVIDAHWVIEGSMNWTREALMRNFESASLIESPELAAAKIKRMESFPLLSSNSETADPGSQKSFSFPLFLMQDASKFPAALEEKEARSLALYLCLLEHSAALGKMEFQISLTEWSEKLRFKRRLLGWFLLNDMRRHLNFLKLRYGVLDWSESQEGQVLITLRTQGAGAEPKIQVPAAIVSERYLRDFSPKTLFVYLIVLYHAQKDGQAPFWMGSLAEVAAAFHTNRVSLIQGLTDLKRMNLIEIFPSEKKKVNGVWQREFTNRYLLNPVLSEAEVQKHFEALEKKSDPARVRTAVKLADSVDEPRDPEVVGQFASFLEHYPQPEVEKATALVAGFSRNNPLRTAAYIRGILEGEAGSKVHSAERK